MAIILLLALASMWIEIVYPKTFLERFNSIAAYYQTDKFVREYISSGQKGNILFIGGSSLFSSISFRNLNLTAKSMGIQDFKAQALFMSGETAESLILFLENVLNDSQVKFLVVDSVRMDLSPMPLNYHDATFFPFFSDAAFFSLENLSRLFSKVLISLNNIFTRIVPIKVDYENRLSKVEFENFGQSIRLVSDDSYVEAGSPRDIRWQASNLPKVDPQSYASRQIKRFFAACEKRKIVPILMIQNRVSREVRGKWIAEHWASFSNFPILYSEPSMIEKKLNVEYAGLFQDRAHLSDLSREKYTKFFSPAFINLIFPKGEAIEYRWWP